MLEAYAGTAVVIVIAVLLFGCRIGGTNALAPVDAETASTSADADPAMLPDAGEPDAAPCQPGVDTDGDGAEDCGEAGDTNPFTDPLIFNGLTATIGDRPEVTGSCNALDDFAEMEGRFDNASNVMNVYAGWEFDTNADNYADPTYGFMPNWSSSQGGRFSVRFSGTIDLSGGATHCFKIDVGATGTGIVTGKNMCAQVYVNAGTGSGQSNTWLVETGYQAESSSANEACVSLPAGAYSFDIVFWYFNVLEQAKLEVRICSTDQSACTPNRPISQAEVQAAT